METNYKTRFQAEYHDLKTRVHKLSVMLQSYEQGSLDFVPTCPVTLLYEQLEVMRHYKLLLEERAEIEEIELGEE